MLPGLEIKQLLDNISFLSQKTGPMSNGSGKFSGLMQNLLNAVGGKKVSGKDGGRGLEGISLQSLSGLKGKKLIAALRNFFLENNISLEDVVANDTALIALKKWLETAGFDTTRIESLIQDLKADPGKQGVPLSELFSMLSELEERDDAEEMLEISALPYIESILSRFLSDPEKQQAALAGVIREGKGIVPSRFLSDPEKQQAALAGVIREGKGIVLSRLVANLKKTMQQLPEKGRSVPDGPAQQLIAKLMSRMGMTPENSTLTLERFVSELEKMAAKIDGAPKGQSIVAADLNRFVENLSWMQDPRKGTEPLKVIKEPGTASHDNVRVAAPEHALSEGKFDALKKPVIAVEEHAVEAKNSTTSAEDMTTTARVPDRIASPAVKLPVRTLPAYVLNQVSRQIVRTHQNGIKQIQIQLHPPNLGRLHMNIDGSGDGVRVNIVAEQQGTQELLLSHTGGLKSMLMEQGFRLEKIDIQFDQFFDQSFAYARQESNKSNGRRQRGSDSQQNRDIEPTVEMPSGTTQVKEGLLDLVA